MDALKIALKDLRLLSRDRRSVVILLVLPIVLISVIGSSTSRLMSGGTADERRVRVHLLDYADTELSQRLTGFLAAAPDVQLTRGIVAAVQTGHPPERSSLPPGDFDAEIVIDRDVMAIRDANPAQMSTAAGVPGVQFTVSPGSSPLLGNYMRLLIEKSAQQSRTQRRIPEPNTVDVAEADPGRTYRFVVPGFTVLFVFFIVTIMGRSFLLERELGTLRRLRIAPVSAPSILAGKTLPFLVVSVAQTTVLLLTGRFLFGMPLGSAPWLLIPLVLLTSLAATTLGLAFSTWVRTESQVSAWGNLVVLGTAGISGCLVPRQWMPELTQRLSLATPHAWALEAYREILSSDAPQATTVLVSCGVLAGFALLFFLIGLAGFRRDAGLG